MYLTVKPLASVRTLIRESGTFLLSCLRISERGRLIPDVGTTSSSSAGTTTSTSFATALPCFEEAALAAYERE